MPGHIIDDTLPLDATTSREVAKGIGERLRLTLGNDTPFPDRLQRLLDRMRELETRENGTTGKAG
jgi:3-dehydroquinate synthetase